MKTIVFFSFSLFLLIISGCREEHKEPENLNKNSSTYHDSLSLVQTPNTESKHSQLSDCNFVYDTITRKAYQMHLHILDKFNHKEKRGYVRDSNGDTINNFLYHQDISAFIASLEPSETGVYYTLTNKVVFLILEQDPQMLDYGLPVSDNKNFFYFLEHIKNPICNNLSIDSIAKNIILKMNEPHEKAKNNKRLLLEHLRSIK